MEKFHINKKGKVKIMDNLEDKILEELKDVNKPVKSYNLKCLDNSNRSDFGMALIRMMKMGIIKINSNTEIELK